MSRNHDSFCIQGKIALSRDVDSFTDATVTVYLEEVSRINAPSKTIAKQVISNVQHQRGIEQRVAFALEVEIVDKQASYSIRAHVSLQGNEQIHVGDYVTVQSYPVSMSPYPDPVSIQVQQVK